MGFDDDAVPVISAIYIVIDAIIFMLMISAILLFFQAGFEITGQSRRNMTGRDIATASETAGLKSSHIKAAQGSTTKYGNYDSIRTQYMKHGDYGDGILTGEEVINSLVAMSAHVVKQTDNHGNVLYEVKENNDTRYDPKNNLFEYTDNVNIGELYNRIDVGTKDDPVLYERVYTMSGGKSGMESVSFKKLTPADKARIFRETN